MNNEIKKCEFYKDDEINQYCSGCELYSTFCDAKKDCYYKQLLAEQAENKKLVEEKQIYKNALELSAKNIDNCRQGRYCTKCYISDKCSFYACYKALNEVNNEK